MLIYNCPEYLRSYRTIKEVNFHNYELLHPEGKDLIGGWFDRACLGLANAEQEPFEPFIFAWFSFNSWAACVTDTNSDSQLIDALAANKRMNLDFEKLLNNPDSKLRLLAVHFALLLPIFDVRTLNRRHVRHIDAATRREGIDYYLNYGITAFEPKCWKRHTDDGEVVPLDWAHILRAIYKVRCNLFHGHKSAHSGMDRLIVSSAFRTLINFVKEAGYLDK